jgi:ribosomal protein L44E
MSLKVCTDCNQEKSVSEFKKGPKGSLVQFCDDCRRKRREAKRFDSEQKYKAAGFEVVTKSYYTCPHCKKIVGEVGE